MTGETSHSIEGKVFLGKEGRNRDFKKKIDVAASSIHINRILNPSTQEEKDNRNLNATELVKTLGGQDSFNVESVKALKQIKDDNSKTETQKKIAEERLVILGKSVFWDMKEGHDPALQDLLGRASAAEIDNMLPEPLKGLGKEVVKNVITNPSILKGLRKLDDIKQNYDLKNPRDKSLFLGKIEKVYDEMSEIEGLSGDEREQLYMVKAYLNTEMQALSGEEIVLNVIIGAEDEEQKRVTVKESGEVRSFGEWDFKMDSRDIPSRDDSEDERQRKIQNIHNLIERRNKQFEKTVEYVGGGRGGRSREGEQKEIITDLALVRRLLSEIEESGRDVSDLSLNSHKFTLLKDIATAIRDGTCVCSVDSDRNKNRRLEPNGLKELAREIDMRLFLNDLFLATSDVHDLEGISKVMIAFHKGDTNQTLDAEMISFFLSKGSENLVANGLPVDIAWDMRQEGYFNYGGTYGGLDTDPGYDGEGKRIIVKEINGPNGLLDRIARDRPELITEGGMTREKFLDVAILMRKSEKFGINENYYTNFRNDLNNTRREIVKKYTIEQMRKKSNCSQKDAEAAFELARKLSVATYTDSAANVAFADGDDYAELIMFKFLRYQDGVEVSIGNDGEKKPPKNKPIGSTETIKYVDTLTPNWLATVANNESDRGMWKPLYAKDINSRKISGKSDACYHFGSIVLKKAFPAKEVLMSKAKKDEVTDPNIVQSTYERLSKAVSEVDKAGWRIFNPDFFKISTISETNPRSTKDLIREQRFLRFIYVMGVLERATKSPNFGWSRLEYDRYEDLLMRGRMLYDVNSEAKETFISQEQLDYIQKAYSPRKRFSWMDAERRADARKIF
jgi:hypothetical protein